MSGRRAEGRVRDKVALISGGASGLGRESARVLAIEGASVVVADIDAGRGRAAAAELGGEAFFLDLDVTREESWIAAVQAVMERFGHLDILLNSAGVAAMNSVEDTSLEEWRQVHAVNLDGTFLGCKHGIAAMKQTRDGLDGADGGSIVNISSVSGLVGGRNLAAYNSSKGGVRLLTKSVALHCAHAGYGIRCNSVHPTFIDTPMVRALLKNSPDPATMRHSLDRQIPLGRLGEAREVADMVLYLASDESAFVTGAEFVIDGGLTAR